MTIFYPGGKLVRDKLPTIALEQGDDAKFSIAPDLVAALKRKLVEEAYEVGAACSTRDLAEEIADVIDVAMALAKTLGITDEEINKAAAEKYHKRGGFTRGIILESYVAGALRND